MPRLLMHAAYDGTRYEGWQSQPHGNTLQDTIEREISRITRQQHVRIYGSGRTDTGVHAEDQPFHVDLQHSPDLADLTHRLNRVLPEDIAIRNVQQVSEDFHARFDAGYRQYRYQLTLSKNPLWRHVSCLLRRPFDPTIFEEALWEFEGNHDFRRFCVYDENRNSTRCRISLTRFEKLSDDFFIVRIGGNRFMRHMVRYMIGTLLHLSREKISRQLFYELLTGENPGMNPAPCAPPEGLILEKVLYEEK